MQPLEIERKFLIAMPESSWLNAQTGVRREEITQTYLLCEPGEERRVRRRSTPESDMFVKTVKRAVSGAKRVEIEEAITRGTYDALLKQADPGRRTIEKTRWSIPFEGHMLEIDVYPFWRKKAVLEIELRDENEEFSLPQAIQVICEVTDDTRYKNASLAKAEDPSLL